MEECNRLKAECEQMIPDIPSVLATLVEPRIHVLEHDSKEGETKLNNLIGQCSALAKQIQTTAVSTSIVLPLLFKGSRSRNVSRCI